MSIFSVLEGKRTWWVEQGHVLDVLATIPDKSVQMVVTSPPYYSLRDYQTEPLIWGGDPECEHQWNKYTKPGNTWGVPNKNTPGLIHKSVDTNTSFVGPREQAFCVKCGAWRGDLGNEPLHDCGGWVTGNCCGSCYVCNMTRIFMEIWRVLRDDGVCFINIGDSYAHSGGSGSGEYQKRHKQFGKVVEPGTYQKPRTAPKGLKPKDLCGVPWRLALSLQARGWYLRNDIVWHKNALPESVRDRCSVVHEYVFLLTKKPNYYFDQEAIREPYHPDSIKRKEYPTCKLGAEPGQPMVKGSSGALGGGVNVQLSYKYRGANKTSIWRITNEPTKWDYCCNCKSIFVETGRKKIKRKEVDDGHGNKKTIRICPVCGSSTDWVKHYAIFPTALPSNCIKAGSSHKTCSACGAPYERILEPSEEYAKFLGKGYHDHSNDKEQGMLQSKKPNLRADYVTKGWRPTCKCNAPAGGPSIVLDPFSGSGRSGLAALRLGRRYIGIELNEKYVEASRRLIEEDMPLFNIVAQGV